MMLSHPHDQPTGTYAQTCWSYNALNVAETTMTLIARQYMKDEINIKIIKKTSPTCMEEQLVENTITTNPKTSTTLTTNVVFG